VLLHQLGQDIVLPLELLLQGCDALLGLVGLGAGADLEGSHAVLEELLLPVVEQRGVNAGLFADGGNRDLVEQVPAQDGNLFLGTEMLTRFEHECSPLF
jgi:hypothetical protein